MLVQVVATYYVTRAEHGGRVQTARGQTVDLPDTEAQAAIVKGLVREPSDAPLPAQNAGAVDTRPTTPAGVPIDVDSADTAGGFTSPRSHAEADDAAATAGVTFPTGTKLDAKVEALRQLHNAQAHATATTAEPTLDADLADLSDAELVQKAVDLGHSETETEELSHDELVAFVAEAVSRRSNTPAGQAEILGQ